MTPPPPTAVAPTRRAAPAPSPDPALSRDPALSPAPAQSPAPRWAPLAGTVPAPARRRLVGHLVDAAALLPGGLLAGAAALPLLPGAGDGQPGARVALVLVGVLVVAATVAAQTWSDAARGWTLGKRACDLRTVSARTGAPVGDVGALLRGWHDLADGTLVIDVRATPGPVAPAAGGPGADGADRADRADNAVLPPWPPVLAPDPPTWPASERAATGSATAPATVAEPATEPATGARPATADEPVAEPATQSGPATVAEPGAQVPGLPPAATLTVPVRVPVAALLTARAVPAVPTPRPAVTRPVGPAAERPAGPWVEVVLSDGRTLTVAGTALLGRDPVERTGETPGTLVPVDDPARSVSKTHLALGADASGAWVVDRRSTNGTVVTLADGQQIFCVPEERVRLREGATVGFGGHAFTVTALSTTAVGTPTGDESAPAGSADAMAVR